MFQETRPEQPPGYSRRERWDGLLGEERPGCPRCLGDQFEVTVDGARLGWKVLLHAIRETLPSADEIVRAISDQDAVVDIRHRTPFEAAFADVVKDAADGRGRVVNFADVMDAHVPFVARAMEDVRKAAGGVVALQHQHSLGGMLG